MTRILVLASLLLAVQTNAQQTFSNFQDLLAYVDQKNITGQINNLKLQQARKAQWAAAAEIPDPSLNNALNFTNNTALPVNLFPAEAFGGQPGEYREVQTGVQYNTAVSTNLNVQLINLEAWQNLKLAKLNVAITETDNQLNLKSLFENLAVCYYNIIQLQAQLESTKKNLVSADTLLQVVNNKYEEGLAKLQDVNDSRVSQLNLQEQVRQIEFLIRQQELALKMLCDIPEQENIVLTENQAQDFVAPVQPTIVQNSLLLSNQQLKERYAFANYKKANYAFLPTVSFVANNSYNQYNQDFTLFGGNWIHSQYLGLRLNFNLPNAITIAKQSKNKYDYLLSQKNTEKAGIKSSLEQQQLRNDWQKAVSQQASNAQMLALQQDSYQKNKTLYSEGVLGIDRVLNSFTSMVNAEYNLIASQVSVLLALEKIKLNNKFN